MVSIVITNHNYGRFVADAIESALDQTHPDVEVVVVDDGSTDDSRRVIDQFAGRVILIAKQNGGQASAFNAGFAASSGDAVIFLDADDALHADTAAAVAAAFRGRPELVKVHYRLELADAEGRPTGTLVPPAALPLPRGDLRERIRRHADDVPYPPCSGNAFAAWALRRVLPMPEAEFRVLADVYLLNTVPLLGPVEALDRPLGTYRVHGANRHRRGALDLEAVRSTIRVTHATHKHVKALGDSLGLDGFAEAAHDQRSLVFLGHRLVSKKLAPELHPLTSDRVARLALTGVSASARHSASSVPLRLLHAGWFVAFALAPPRVAIPLAEQLLHPERRGRLGASVDRLRRRS